MNDKLTAVGVERLNEYQLREYLITEPRSRFDHIHNYAITELLRLREQGVARRDGRPVSAEVIVERKCKHDVALWAHCTACEAESLAASCAPSPVCAECNGEKWVEYADPPGSRNSRCKPCPRCQPAADAKVCGACQGRRTITRQSAGGYQQTKDCDCVTAAAILATSCPRCEQPISAHMTEDCPKPEPGAEGVKRYSIVRHDEHTDLEAMLVDGDEVVLTADYDTLQSSLDDARRELGEALIDCDGYKAGEAVQLERAEKAEAENARLREAAGKWSALIGCARIRVIGTSGMFGVAERAHFGAEFWTHYEGAETDPQSLEVLERFVAKAAALTGESK